MSKKIEFRVSFTTLCGKRKRVRLPALYALSFVRSNIARQVSPNEVLLYRGYALHVDKQRKAFFVYSDLPVPPTLCRYLHRVGLHWEASHLAGKVASQSFHRMSLTPYMDAADFQDRHLLLAGSTA